MSLQTSKLTLQSLPPLPLQKTTLLLNNFILTTTRFLNAFVASVDEKLLVVGDKINDLEILVQGLEAKLASVPDEVVSSSSSAAPSQPQQQPEQQQASAPPPAPAPAPASSAPSSAAPQQALATVSASTELAVVPNGVPAKEHPRYAKYFKQLKVGVPEMQVESKCAAEGLDVAVLKGDPNAIIPVDDEDREDE